MENRTSLTAAPERSLNSALRTEDFQIRLLANKCRAKKRLQELDHLSQCQSDPLYWLQNHTNTFDEHWKQKKSAPYARFPKLPYMPKLFELMRKERRLLLPKSRDMMVSWAAVAYGVHLCQFNPRSRVMIQSQKEDKVMALVSGRGNPGYARTLWEQQDDFLKTTHPLVKAPEDMPGDLLAWANGSTFQGVPRGADQVRQFHPTLVIFDEAAHLDEFAEAYAAADPVAAQIIAISSAAPSWFGEVVEEAFQNSASVVSELMGCDSARHRSAISVFRIKYSADPKKDEDWVKKMRPTYSSDQAWRQEQEVDFTAYAGQLVFPEFKREYTVVEPREIPPDVTWWMGIDPHPRTPHAFLWMFVDRWGNHVYAREYWPSKAYGKRGNIPEDDDLYQIDEYVDAINYLEGSTPNLFAANGFTDNRGREQKVFRRIMDPAGKAWAVSREMGKDSEETFWDAYRKLGIHCDPARKDFQAGRDKVGTRLRPVKYAAPAGTRYQSQILIFNTCKELIFEIENNRYPLLTPSQATRKDPVETPLQKRCHFADLLRYLEIEDPYWIDPQKATHEERRQGYAPYSDVPGFIVND